MDVPALRCSAKAKILAGADCNGNSHHDGWPYFLDDGKTSLSKMSATTAAARRSSDD